MGAASVKLTDRELDVLRELEWLHERHDQCNRNFMIDGVMTHWGTPQYFGGSNGSHHSATATALAKKGLVDRYKGGRINFFESHIKGSCYYRITKAGLDALRAIASAKGDAK